MINLNLLLAISLTIINFYFYNISEIYSLEAKFILTLSSLLLILKMIENNSTTINGDTIYDNVFLIFSIVTLYIIIPISISTDVQLLYLSNSSFITNLKNFFMFWI